MDDSVLVEGANTTAALENKINISINVFSNMCQELNLHLNLTKTEPILLGKNTMKKRKPIFKHHGTSIPVKDNITYLGFLLDSTFSWMDHLDMIRCKLISFTCNVRKVRILDIGVSAQLLKSWLLKNST